MHVATHSAIQLHDLTEVELLNCGFSPDGKLIQYSDSSSIRLLMPIEKAHLRAASYWLHLSQEVETPHLEKIQGFLETAHHLRQVQAWELASQVLFVQPNKEDDLALYQQLGSLGWFQEQIDYYLALRGKINSAFDHFCLKELGDAYINLCQYDRAINTFQDLLQLARQDHNTLSEAQALESLGLCHAYLGDNNTGLTLCKQSLQSLQENQTHPNRELRQQKAKTLVTASFIAVYLRKYRPARHYAQEALAIARQINDPKTEWFALARLATCYCQQGQNKKAFYYIEQQYLQRHQVKDLRQINVMLTCFSVITCSLRKFDLAIESLQEGIQLQKTIGDTNRQYHLLSLLAYIYIWRNEYQSAIACCQECLHQSKRYGYRGYQVMALAQLSYLQSGLGNLGTAERFAKRSLAISRHFEDCLSKAASFTALSLVYLHQKKYFLGISCIIKSLRAVAPITSGDSKAILALLFKRLFKPPIHPAQADLIQAYRP
jgi:tetratricopeptide (TPR) repeat protein